MYKTFWKPLKFCMIYIGFVHFSDEILLLSKKYDIK